MELWPHFADDQVDTFWAKNEEERAGIWGPPLDLAEALADFRPEHVPDEQPAAQSLPNRRPAPPSRRSRPRSRRAPGARDDSR